MRGRLAPEAPLGRGQQRAVAPHERQISTDPVALVDLLRGALDRDEQVGEAALDEALGVVVDEPEAEVRVDAGGDPTATGRRDDLGQPGVEERFAPVEDLDEEQVVADLLEHRR